MAELNWVLRDTDRDILLALASKIRETADSPRNQELRNRWLRHDECKGDRPLLLTETDGGLKMVLPNYRPRCVEPWAKNQEKSFVDMLCHSEVIRDDRVIEPVVNVGWHIGRSGYGVDVSHTSPETDGFRGAVHINPVIDDLDTEFDKLKPCTFSVDRDSSIATRDFLEDLYQGVLGVRMRGNSHWTMGLTIIAIDLIGLEGLMLKMYDQPEGLHRLMGYLRDQNLAFLRWMEKEKLLNLNNENDYIGSGSCGYTHALPQPGYSAESGVRIKDLWLLLESQETVSVGPDQYEEFVFQYENSIAREAGRVYYGCCEPVNTRWHVLKHMANLKRVSVSPWCDQAIMARELGDRFGYSRKPNPSLISTDVFDETAIRADLRETMQLAKENGCSLEIAMKDVHTLNDERDRLTRWVNLAREISDEVYGQ